MKSAGNQIAGMPLPITVLLQLTCFLCWIILQKLNAMPIDELEHEKEVQERKERRQLMANARAERARKRSAEISSTPPVIPVKRKDGRGRKGRTQE